MYREQFNKNRPLYSNHIFLSKTFIAGAISLKTVQFLKVIKTSESFIHTYNFCFRQQD